MTPVQALILAEIASNAPNDGYTVTYVDVDEESLLKTMDVIHKHNKKYPDGYFNV